MRISGIAVAYVSVDGFNGVVVDSHKQARSELLVKHKHSACKMVPAFSSR